MKNELIKEAHLIGLNENRKNQNIIVHQNEEDKRVLTYDIFLQEYVYCLYQIFDLDKPVTEEHKLQLYGNLYDKYKDLTIYDFLHLYCSFELTDDIRRDDKELDYVLKKWCPTKFISNTNSNTLYNLLDCLYEVLDEEYHRIGYLTEYEFDEEFYKLEDIYDFSIPIEKQSISYWYDKYPDIYPGMTPDRIITRFYDSTDSYYKSLLNFYTEDEYRNSNLIENGFDCAIKFLKRVLKDTNHPKKGK